MTWETSEDVVVVIRRKANGTNISARIAPVSSAQQKGTGGSDAGIGVGGGFQWGALVINLRGNGGYSFWGKPSGARGRTKRIRGKSISASDDENCHRKAKQHQKAQKERKKEQKRSINDPGNGGDI